MTFIFLKSFLFAQKQRTLSQKTKKIINTIFNHKKHYEEEPIIEKHWC